MGAAIGWAIAILVNNLVPLAQVRSALGLHPFGRATGVAALWALLACGVLPSLLLMPLEGTLGQLAGVLVGAGVVYAAGLLALRKQLEIPGRRRRVSLAEAETSGV